VNRRDLIGTLVGLFAGIGTIVSINETKPKSVECPVDAHDDANPESVGRHNHRLLQAEINRQSRLEQIA